MSEAKHACCVRVYGTGFTFRGSACSKKAKVERNGNWYCGIHDPVHVAAKRAERDKKWAEQSAKRTAALRLESAALEMRDLLERAASRIWQSGKDNALAREIDKLLERIKA